MPVKWHSTNYPGVRFYEHPTRKHGVRKDRYFTIYYRVDGKRREEALEVIERTAAIAGFDISA